jgi:hypothetical protein
VVEWCTRTRQRVCHRLVTGLTIGNAVVLASVEGKQGSAMITVRQVSVASLTINPAACDDGRRADGKP